MRAKAYCAYLSLCDLRRLVISTHVSVKWSVWRKTLNDQFPSNLGSIMAFPLGKPPSHLIDLNLWKVPKESNLPALTRSTMTAVKRIVPRCQDVRP
ncbi:hypothetical protein TNCV_2362601 [Trichonephila clavipes]|nr:hypothetical protein TNCV_2362601 [Trichonephila clavipes]